MAKISVTPRPQNPIGVIKTPCHKFQTFRRNLRQPACIRLHEVLTGMLEPEWFVADGRQYFHFNPNCGEKLQWGFPALRMRRESDQPSDLNTDPCLEEFRTAFDALHSLPFRICGPGFMPDIEWETATRGFFSHGWFSEFRTGTLLYEDGGGGFICRTPENLYWWLVGGDDEPKFISDSFEEFLTEFTDGLISDSIGLDPYPR